MTNNKRKVMFRTVILVVTILALAGVAGLGTVAYAQAASTSAVTARPDSFFDPFTLGRVLLSADDSGTSVMLLANLNNNGNGNPSPGPPITVPARPEYRSNWCPPFGHAFGRNGI